MSLLHEPNPLPTHHPKTEQATLLCTTTAETSSLFLTSSHPSDDPSFEYYYKQYYLDSSYNTPSNYSTYLSSSLKLISNFPSNTTQLFHKQLLSKTQSLPFTPYKKTLILDMDETLIHADVDYKFKYHDTILKFKYQDDETGNDEEEINIPLILRPHLFDFLNIVSQQYELILFTASEKAYADAIVDYIEKERKYFNKRLYRDSCLYLNPGLYIKDLSIFDNRKMEDIVIVDNSIFCFANNISNGILISSFYNDENDDMLMNVVNYLGMLCQCTDVREENKKYFRFEEFLKEMKE
jgi:Dullard-like phosphatase family protein